ncbi:hypothetical protein K431DRAFT_281399 [Polychaeton citri CBS 116435]|uniref:Symplekin/Pta1 N-terminal domain-containing protein n=1 Tax=Polychaeton citri CBS 116435 TaxID=1314669 RepID=A0A9P4QHE4_9PEZI|nr:hypothetical protein K431DRAFT_281399 [Polychaeton citri CBS 116435]
MTSPAEVVKQLNSARDICLRDPAIYPQVVPGVLHVIGSGAHVDLRRWGADFLAETFASPVLVAEKKEEICVGVLDTLRGYLFRKDELGEEEDANVVKSAVQCAASIYPLIFRHTVNNANDKETWMKMAGIKSAILRRMDTAPAGVRICCIKFVARVVQVQTPGLISDPRRQEQNEISLALVGRDHPIIPSSHLEAEASGLLDRLLGTLQDYATDPLIVTAAINSMASIVQRRPSISNKVLSALMSFNPLTLAQDGSRTGKDQVAVRSMTRTVMSFLINILKRNNNHPLAGRMQQHVERLRHSLVDAFSDHANHLKRSAPDEPTDGLDNAKRARIEANTTHQESSAQGQPQPLQYPPLPPGPVTVAQLFTLTNDTRLTSFHAEAFPATATAQLVQALLSSADLNRLNGSVNTVRARILELGRRPVPSALDAAKEALGQDDEDDYDPVMTFDGDREQVENEIDVLSDADVDADVAIGAFHLPPPAPLSRQEQDECIRTSVMRVFGTLAERDKDLKIKGGKKANDRKGFNAISSIATSDRDGWVTLLTRLATRTNLDILNDPDKVKQENNERALAKKTGGVLSLSTGIREALVHYIMEDWRRRIDVAVAWLNEEWYCDRLHSNAHLPHLDPTSDIAEALPNYHAYTIRLLDGLLPYIDTRDNRALIRLFSEVPALDREMMARLKKLAQDPERVQLACQCLLYLIMLRPPVREMAIDCAEEMWMEIEESRVEAAKVLKRWRPGRLEELESGVKQEI